MPQLPQDNERAPLEWLRGDPADAAVAHADPLSMFLGVIEEGRPSWHADAECSGSDVEFTSKDRAMQARAFNLCGRCTVRSECLAWSLTFRDDDAILGGLSPNARRRLIKRKIEATR